jgi:hypothetical protein
MNSVDGIPEKIKHDFNALAKVLMNKRCLGASFAASRQRLSGLCVAWSAHLYPTGNT